MSESIENRKEMASKVFGELEKDGIPIHINSDGISASIKNGDGSSLDMFVGTDQIHVASVIPETQKTGIEYLQDADEYQNLSDRLSVIDLSRKAFRREGVVGTAIEAYVEIPTMSGYFINCENEELKTLLKYWCENVGNISDENISSDDVEKYSVNMFGGIVNNSIKILTNIYVDGDCVMTDVWKNVGIPQLGGVKRNVPARFMFHDPKELEINETMAKMGYEVITASYDPNLISLLQAGGSNDAEKRFVESIPKNIKDSILQEKSSGFVLHPQITTHLSRKTDDREPWGRPFIERAFSGIAYKHRLRALDIATIDGLVQRLWIVKIGNDDSDSPLHIPDNARVQLAVNALKKLVANNMMVWGGSDIKVEKLETGDSSVLSFESRYNSADDDIFVSLGFNKSLITGNSGDAFTKIISQMEKYSDMLRGFYNKKFRQIAMENGYKDQYPTFEWQFLKLNNTEKYKTILTKLYEYNVIGIRRLLNMSGLPGDEVIEELISEGESGLRDKLPKNYIPYTKNSDPGRPDDSKDGEDDSYKNKPSNPDSNRDGK